jgi:IgGFc binding protein
MHRWARWAVLIGISACGNGNRFDGTPDAAVDGFQFADGGTCGSAHCSGDLHNVLCDDGTVLQSCPPDQGCAGGTCVPACQAASSNKTTIGCEYWTLYPDIDDTQANDNDCFAVFIANTWGSPVSVSVEYDNASLAGLAQAAVIPSGSGQSVTYAPLPGGQIPAGQVAILFLSASPTALVPCPTGVTPLMTTDPATHGTGVGHAFHITTSDPVVGYQIVPYGGGNSEVTSATLLLPTSVWGTNYVGVDAYDNLWPNGPWLVIMAQQDGTNVQLTPTSAVTGGGGVPAIAASTLGTITLNRGRYAQLELPTGSELNGTPIQSNYPIAVFGGNTGMDVPEGQGFADAAHQQIPPVTALGREYVGVKYRDRFAGTPETPPWRVVGAVDGTILTWDPAPPGAPATLSAGQMVEFESGGPFVVRSQDANHPFYMAQYMTGCEAVWDGSDCRGDPEFVNIIPPQQYLSSYVLFTDPTYPETELVIIRAAGTSGFQDVTLDCVGTLSGWQPVGTSNTYEYTRADLVTGNFAKVGGCDNGRHTLSSNGFFGVTVWGWGSAATGGTYRCDSQVCAAGCPSCAGVYSQAVSYAYPAGASVQSINTVEIVPK